MNSRSTPIEDVFARESSLVREILSGLVLSDPAAVVYYEACVHTGGTVQCAANALPRVKEALRERRWTGVGVELCGESSRYCSTEDVSPGGLRTLARKHGGSAGISEAQFASGAPERHPAATIPADAPHLVTVSEKEALLEEALDAALGADERVASATVSYRDETRCKMVVSREGIFSTADFRHSLAVEIALLDGSEWVMGRAFGGGAYPFHYWLSHPPTELASRAADQARTLSSAKTISSSGTMPVIFGPGWGGVWLHEAVGHMLEADVRGPAHWRAGERVAPPFVSISDDPAAPGGRGSLSVDDEGIAAAPTPLIDGGVLVRRLTNRSAALEQGVPLTGNGRRQDFRFPALPRMTNLVLHPAKTRADELIGSVASGIYVREPAGGSLHPERGTFHVDVAEGYRIEHGRVTSAIEPVRIRGRIGEVLNGISGIASDFEMETARGFCEKGGQVVPISIGQPAVLFGGLEVSPLAA